MKLKIKKLSDLAIKPEYQTPGAACFDLHACFESEMGSVNVSASAPAIIGTGLAFEVPQGFAMLVFSRSGHGFSHDVRLANCVGVIDSDYRGEVKVKLTCDNTMGKRLVVEHGQRIAQAMIVPAVVVDLIECDELSETERGAGGFGSTGAA